VAVTEGSSQAILVPVDDQVSSSDIPGAAEHRVSPSKAPLNVLALCGGWVGEIGLQRLNRRTESLVSVLHSAARENRENMQQKYFSLDVSAASILSALTLSPLKSTEIFYTHDVTLKSSMRPNSAYMHILCIFSHLSHGTFCS